MFKKFEAYQMVSEREYITVTRLNGQHADLKVSYIGKALYDLLIKTKF